MDYKEKKNNPILESCLLHAGGSESASPVQLQNPDGKRSNDWQSQQGSN